MAAPLVSVVIPTYNRAAALGRVLGAFEAQRPADLPFEVVVVDDGSSDGTAETLAAWRGRRFALRRARQDNAGPAAARNRAIAIASGELVLFGGDDIEPHPDLIAEHLAEHRRRADPRLAVLGLTRWPDGVEPTSTMRRIDGPGGEQFSYAAFTDGAEYDFRHFYTSNVSLRRDLLAREPGGFSTAFPAAAFEDAELAYRLSRRGLRIVYRAAALAWHHHLYDARAFFVRQIRCGAMADVLLRLHPQLAKWVDLRTLEWHRLEVVTAGAPYRAKVARIRSELELWEERSVNLAVFLDRPATDLAEPLLAALFRYGFVKGLAAARFGPEVGRTVAADQWLRLLPVAVDRLRGNAGARRVPLPARDPEAIIAIARADLSA
ncbi:MAG: glycosyltransferase [Thermoanaerobaculales bacterium]|nr:glycosyltransferase [Thermoanaerobaculales bacterium]